MRVRAQSLVSDASRNLEPCSARRCESNFGTSVPTDSAETPAVHPLEVGGCLEQELAGLLPRLGWLAASLGKSRFCTNVLSSPKPSSLVRNLFTVRLLGRNEDVFAHGDAQRIHDR